ncbi:MAG: NADPH-dependent 7-cyano-7-deazaguanine reductase QueF [Desulfovibrio sp.]|nr:NADPH-dependent 7-cyano-7-deazaguanine reductase QueF [Desulfovibrio sp.]
MLEAFPNRFPGRPYIIRIVFPEYTSLCPVTGQPDFGTIYVEYIPDRLCVESKSFKLYMFAWRNERAFMESITNAILDDLCGAIAPLWCQVKGIFVPRGGTQIQVFAEEFKETDPLARQKAERAAASWKLAQNCYPG